jgi:NTP pyrophosphatase (non-canonical NTP hydrolase)
MDLNWLAEAVHRNNATWWHDPATGERLNRNKGEMLMLIVSEISEAMEGERKDLMDDHLPHRKMAEVELADALIRIFDYAGAHSYDLQGAFDEKMAYNAQRSDHKPENRLKQGGKKW